LCTGMCTLCVCVSVQLESSFKLAFVATKLSISAYTHY